MVHISLGTVDDRQRPGRFRRAVRRAMRVVGEERCVVWANIWRPTADKLNWASLNRVLKNEARLRDNLIVVDWAAMVRRHMEWISPIDGTHVNRRGSWRRARAIARAAHDCRSRLAARPPASG